MIQHVLVLGATGGTGTAIVDACLARDLTVTVFGRSLTKLRAHFPSHVSYAQGDVFDAASIVTAGAEADLIIQCAAVPYHETVARQLPLAESVMTAAKQLGVRVVYVDGIYAYGASTGHPVSETAPLRPISKKGQIKAQLTQLLFSDIFQTVPTCLIRLPDYFGPSAQASSYLGLTLMGIAACKPTFYIGSRSVSREYIFLPDAAEMILNVALSETNFTGIWNIPGQQITGDRLIKLASDASGDHKPLFTLTKPALRFLGLFDADLKEIVEMYYLTKKPVILDGRKYQEAFGDLIETSFEHSVPFTIGKIALAHQK